MMAVILPIPAEANNRIADSAKIQVKGNIGSTPQASGENEWEELVVKIPKKIEQREPNNQQLPKLGHQQIRLLTILGILFLVLAMILTSQDRVSIKASPFKRE
ncbi:hypothetical protein [Candidatus Enterococcus murrayae]|uniref:Cell wall surface anchor family protein n=1 Tax=Candidatus Enterococcus murrayae TaxID=2815321 RepID=A0ABS3HI76_9ENTE|nr:hypothetical protein [Enterococcus sp. MJM16]MBO0452978.1 hypothetical protein [Enterococcus sp. MJM16]